MLTQRWVLTQGNTVYAKYVLVDVKAKTFCPTREELSLLGPLEDQPLKFEEESLKPSPMYLGMRSRIRRQTAQSDR